VACIVVFASDRVRLKLSADEVSGLLGSANRPLRFEREEGGAVWINPPAVLYITEPLGDANAAAVRQAFQARS
jgi:hypothetical protein